MNYHAICSDLKALAPGSRVLSGVSLSDYSTWRIGGVASVVISPAGIEDISNIRQYIHKNGLPYVVIGDGSNMLFDDAGFDGVVVRIGRDFSGFRCFPDTGEVTADAGIWTPCFVRKVAKAGLKGCEHAIGVPGTLGGLIVMNGGTQRKGIGEQIATVTIVEKDGEIRDIDGKDCDFSYRHSIFQGSGNIVARATFNYEKGDISFLRGYMIKTLYERNRKFPRKMPNCGSVFLSDPDIYREFGPPGKVVEDTGLKGMTCGNAQVSELHANFIVNLGGATSRDVLTLIARIRRKVFERTGFWLECEARHLTPAGHIVQAHVSAEKMETCGDLSR